jgi:Zn-finger nucleic acid-binding protein
MARWLCTGCKVTYGEGENKPRFGYCPCCWEVWLARCRLNVALAQQAWRSARR